MEYINIQSITAVTCGGGLKPWERAAFYPDSDVGSPASQEQGRETGISVPQLPFCFLASEIATLQEQLLTSEAAVRSLQAALRQRDELVAQLRLRAELLQDICHRRPPLAGLLAALAEAERLGPLPASDPSHPLPGLPSPPLANSTGAEGDRDHLQPAVFGTTV